MRTNFAKSHWRRVISVAAVAAVGIALSACGPQIANRGNKPHAEDLARIKPGVQTRSEVQGILGSPSSRSLYGQETWFYISGTRESEAFFKPEETERDIVAITFNAQGVVETVSNLDKADGENLQFSEKKTPTAGHNMTIVEQMIGNLGRFNSTNPRDK